MVSSFIQYQVMMFGRTWRSTSVGRVGKDAVNDVCCEWGWGLLWTKVVIEFSNDKLNEQS